MALYKGSIKTGSFYLGSTKIGKLYKGNTLVYGGSIYKPDQVIFESATTGTYSLDLLDTGKYEVYCIAGGGSGASGFSSSRFLVASGGSGSAFIGNIALSKGVLSIVVGAGGYGQSDGYGYSGTNSTIGSAVICYAGGGGNAHSSSGRGGAGGSAPSISVTVYSSTLNSAGNGGGFRIGGSIGGGASLYAGYGKGGDSSTSNPQGGASGYVKIIYKGK